jgi:hypothetical protein
MLATRAPIQCRKEARMSAIRAAGVVCLLVLGALGCGKNDDEGLCPEPTQSIAGPDLRPDLSMVPECKPPATNH